MYPGKRFLAPRDVWPSLHMVPTNGLNARGAPTNNISYSTAVSPTFWLLLYLPINGGNDHFLATEVQTVGHTSWTVPVNTAPEKRAETARKQATPETAALASHSSELHTNPRI